MAGIKQHHIWRMLQRGFSRKGHGNKEIWVYHKDRLPEPSTTKEFGKEEYYYGEEGSKADENITSFENSIQRSIQKARELTDGAQVETEMCAKLVSHLEMRSFFVRTEMVRLGEEISSRFGDVFGQKESLEQRMISYAEKNPDIFKNEMKDLDIPPSIIPLFMSHILNVVVPKFAGQIASENVNFFDLVSQRMPEIAKKAHIKALENDFNEVARVKSHSAMIFRVRRFAKGSLILPDTCVAFLKRGGCTPLSSLGDDIEGVIIPLSSEVAVFGSKKGELKRDVDTVNRILASVAKLNFIASENNEVFQKLSAKIGKNAQMITDHQFAKSFRTSVIDNI